MKVFDLRGALVSVRHINQGMNSVAVSSFGIGSGFYTATLSIDGMKPLRTAFTLVH